MKRLIIFDIDRTIYDGSIFLDFSLHLIQKNLISPKFLSSIGFEFVTYQTGFESYDELVRDCLNYFYNEIKIIPLETLEREMKECLLKNHHKFYDYTFEIIKSYSSYDFLIISLEPDFMTKQVANMLRIPNFISNKFTENNLIISDPELKFDKVEFFKQTPFHEIKPFACFGDSESDLNLLKLSDNQFVINPTSVLQKEIKNQNLNYIFFNQENILREVFKKFN